MGPVTVPPQRTQRTTHNAQRTTHNAHPTPHQKSPNPGNLGPRAGLIQLLSAETVKSKRGKNSETPPQRTPPPHFGHHTPHKNPSFVKTELLIIRRCVERTKKALKCKYNRLTKKHVPTAHHQQVKKKSLNHGNKYGTRGVTS